MIDIRKYAQYELRTLSNGLKIMYIRRQGCGVVSIVLYYLVGARDERKGETGFAHLFEHMMFQASQHVKKGEYFKYIESWGGIFNGNTTHERTVYYATLPSVQLPLGLWLEADRMEALAVTHEHVQNQIDTVKEERKFRYENAPYMMAWLKLQENIFSNFHNAHPVIGDPADLDQASLEMVRNFFKTYYRPNNALLVLGGDFDIEDAHQVVAHYFEHIEPGERPNLPDLSEDTPPGGKLLVHSDPYANLPAVFIGYRLPPVSHADYPAISMLYSMLAEGKGSYLYRKLITELNEAVEVYGIWDGRTGPGMMVFLIIFPDNNKARLERTLTLIHDWSRCISKDEIERARQYMIHGLVRSWHDILNVCLDVGERAILDGDPDAYFQDFERFMRVTEDEIRAVVPKYLTEENRVIVWVEPHKS